MNSVINVENKMLAENLRRLADMLEQSDHAHHWHLRVTAPEPMSVSIAALDEPSGVKCGPMTAVFVVGDEAFVSRLKTHIANDA